MAHRLRARWAVPIAVAAFGVLAAQATASAASQPDSGDGTTTGGTMSPDVAQTLSINMQTQQQNEWCWAASGATVLGYEGTSVSQNAFCDGARGLPSSYQCPNQAASSSDIVNGLSAQGASSVDAGGPLEFSSVQGQINGNMPFIAAINWTAGGGHAEVGYGYDSSNQTMSIGDPWPTDQRYTTYYYQDFLSNNQFRWVDTIANIQAGRGGYWS